MSEELFRCTCTAREGEVDGETDDSAPEREDSIDCRRGVDDADRALSRGASAPTPTPRLELTTVDLRPGTAAAFERTIAASQSMLSRETLWYRLVAGGTSPRFLRLRPFSSLAALIESQAQQAFPAAAHEFIARSTVEILNLRPTMSYGLPAHP